MFPVERRVNTHALNYTVINKLLFFWVNTHNKLAKITPTILLVIPKNKYITCSIFRSLEHIPHNVKELLHAHKYGQNSMFAKSCDRCLGTKIKSLKTDPSHLGYPLTFPQWKACQWTLNLCQKDLIISNICSLLHVK